jgi:SAM-dependent methyltransferase
VATRDDDEAGRAFGHIYDTDGWEGGSGIGSAPDATQRYRRLVQRLVGARDIRTVVDVGCGDWQLGELLDWSGVHYTGVDVVGPVVESNRRRYAGPGIAFDLADARVATLPVADLLLAKDVLQHWPNDDVEGFLVANLGRYRYLLLTNDIASAHWQGRVNEDTTLGGWRTLDLESPPFGRKAWWRADFDVRDAWTKRMTLFAGRAARRTRWLPGTALRRVPG